MAGMCAPSSGSADKGDRDLRNAPGLSKKIIACLYATHEYNSTSPFMKGGERAHV